MSMPNHPTPDLRHPEWCDPAYCELLQPQRFSEHRSRPIVIERAGMMFPEKVTVSLCQFAFEAPEIAPIYVSVRFEEAGPNGEVEEVSTHHVRLDRAAELAATLTEMVSMVRGEVR